MNKFFKTAQRKHKLLTTAQALETARRPLHEEEANTAFNCRKLDKMLGKENHVKDNEKAVTCREVQIISIFFFSVIEVTCACLETLQ